MRAGSFNGVSLWLVILRDGYLQLLWEEERADEVWVRGPERDVTLVDVHHVGLGVETILLSSEVVGKRQRREVTRCAERDTHSGDNR
jgi:hypothetical protein